MSEWRIEEDRVRAALAGGANVAPPVSADRLLALGYENPAAATARVAAAGAARDRLLLRVARTAPETAVEAGAAPEAEAS
jgi:hypothetical protein